MADRRTEAPAGQFFPCVRGDADDLIVGQAVGLERRAADVPGTRPDGDPRR